MLYTQIYIYIFQSKSNPLLVISWEFPQNITHFFRWQSLHLAHLRVWRAHPPSCKEWPTRTCQWIRYGFVVELVTLIKSLPSHKIPTIGWTNNSNHRNHPLACGWESNNDRFPPIISQLFHQTLPPQSSDIHPIFSTGRWLQIIHPKYLAWF